MPAFDDIFNAIKTTRRTPTTPPAASTRSTPREQVRILVIGQAPGRGQKKPLGR